MLAYASSAAGGGGREPRARETRGRDGHARVDLVGGVVVGGDAERAGERRARGGGFPGWGRARAERRELRDEIAKLGRLGGPAGVRVRARVKRASERVRVRLRDGKMRTGSGPRSMVVDVATRGGIRAGCRVINPRRAQRSNHDDR